MTHLLFLIPLSIGMGLIGLGAFIWALRHDQFEDPEGNSYRVLIQNDQPDTKGTPMTTWLPTLKTATPEKAMIWPSSWRASPSS